MFHVVSETNPKKIMEINGVWIGSCSMCRTCVNYITSKHSWALNLKWKTINKSGQLMSAIPDDPQPSFGEMKLIRYIEREKVKKLN